MHARGLGIAIVLGLSFPAAAGKDLDSICDLLLHQEEVRLEERALSVELTRSNLTAAESIFGLVDKLWKEEAIERIVYLAAKHDRDVAKIEVERQQLLLRRQEAEVAQYAAACGSGDLDEKALAEASRLYLQADCRRIGKDLAIAEVDLEYRREVLASVKDLREHGAATRQDVIRAERDVERAEKRVARHERRVDACREPSVEDARQP